MLSLRGRPAAGRHERLAERGEQLDLRARALRARLQLGGGVERAAQVADALRVRVAHEGPLGREPEEADGALGVAAGDEVEAQLGSHPRRRRAVGVGEVRADARVQPRAGVGRQQLVEHFAVQVVRERVPVVAPLDQARAAGELVEARRDRLAVAVERGGEGLGGEVAPGDACGPEQLRVPGRQPLELVADMRVQGRRHARLQRPRMLQRHGAGALDDRAVGEPVVEQ